MPTSAKIIDATVLQVGSKDGIQVTEKASMGSNSVKCRPCDQESEKMICEEGWPRPFSVWQKGNREASAEAARAPVTGGAIGTPGNACEAAGAGELASAELPRERHQFWNLTS